jgi:hypothetical protein
MTRQARRCAGPVLAAVSPAAALAVAVTVALTGCASSSGSSSAVSGSSRAVSGSSSAASATKASVGALAPPPTKVTLPPVHARFSYQIGGGYPVPAGVGVLDRDHGDLPDRSVYSICYVNAFQAQSDAVGWWGEHYPNLLLRRSSGSLIIDEGWKEPLFDISTAARRTELLGVIGGWLDGCAARGFQAVEADNLDSYTRSEGRLNVDDALAFGALLTARAHRDHLAIAQKNAAEVSVRAHRVGFDFAIAEECQVYSECASYTAVYGAHVIEIEYTDDPHAAFTKACAVRGNTISIVLRDRDVTPAGDRHHVEQWCPGQ